MSDWWTSGYREEPPVGLTQADGVPTYGEFTSAMVNMPYYTNIGGEDAAIEEAYDQRRAVIKQATGEDIPNPLRSGLPMRRYYGVSPDPSNVRGFQRAGFERKLEELKAKNAGVPEVLEALQFNTSIEDEARLISRGALAEAERAGNAPLNTAAKLAIGFAASTWGSRRDPLFVGSLAVGPTWALGKMALTRIVTGAMVQGGYMGALSLAGSPFVQEWREKIGMETGVMPALEEAGRAALFGLIPGAGIQGLKELGPPLMRLIRGQPRSGDVDKVFPPKPGATIDDLPDANRTVKAAVDAVDADRELVAAVEPVPGVTPETHNDMMGAALKRAGDPEEASPAAVQAIDTIQRRAAEPVATAGEPAEPEPEVGSRRELLDMIRRGAPAEELEAHPLVKRYLDQMSKTAETGTAEDRANPEWWARRAYNIGTEEAPRMVTGRDAVMPAIMAKARSYAKGPVENGRRAVIVIGPPAAGKSTVSNPIAEHLRAALVDADDVKEMIPEYNKGLGNQAVHEESSALANDEAFYQLLTTGSNLVIPKIGASSARTRQLILILKKKGYTVDLVNVSAGIDNSLRRNIQRMLTKGRLVPPDYIREVGDKPSQTAHILRGEANDFADLDTSRPGPPQVREGEGPLANFFRDGGDQRLEPYQGPGATSQRAGGEGGETARGPPGQVAPPSAEKLLSTANKVAADWQEKLGPDIKVVMGGSLVSRTFVPDERPVDMDIRFLTDNPERDYPKVEAVTGLKLRKQRPVEDYPSGSSTAYLVEGPLTRDGVTFDVEAAVRTPAYVGWARFYPQVLTPEELSAFRADKARLSGNKEEYKALKARMLTEVKRRVDERGGPSEADVLLGEITEKLKGARSTQEAREIADEVIDKAGRAAGMARTEEALGAEEMARAGRADAAQAKMEELPDTMRNVPWVGADGKPALVSERSLAELGHREQMALDVLAECK